MKARSSVIVISGMLISGVCGYALNWLIPRTIGFSEYLQFAVFWSALFLTISALSGIQQEVTRATIPSVNARNVRGHAKVALLLVLLFLPLAFISAPFWDRALFPDNSSNYSAALICGAGLYIALAVAMGLFYGAHAWMAVFVATITEGIARLVVILPTLDSPSRLSLLPWEVVLPILTALICGVVFYSFRNEPKQKYTIDVGLFRLLQNSLKTVGASLFMGVMISGLPVVLAMSSGNFPNKNLGVLVALITLIRAPFVILVMAMQSYLITVFKSSTDSNLTARKLSIWIACSGTLLSIIAGIWGVEITHFLFPENSYTPDRLFYVLLIISSSLIAVMSIIGALLLSKNMHYTYLIGWATGALLTIVILFQPWDFEFKLSLGIIIPPAIAISVELLMINKSPKQCNSSA